MTDDKRYVVGFLLNERRSEVALIRKNRPAWQAGRLNGVGGKVEPGEGLADAMAREFEEETGLSIPPRSWDLICSIEWPDDAVRVGSAEPTGVAFFRSISGADALAATVASRTDEAVEVWGVQAFGLHDEVIPNLRWLLPLAAYTADVYQPFTVHATTAEIL